MLGYINLINQLWKANMWEKEHIIQNETKLLKFITAPKI